MTTADQFYEAIIEAEGTGLQRNPYDEVLGYGRYAEPPRPLSSMTIAEVEEWADHTLRPIARRDGFDSSATGAFQITAQNLRRAINEWGFSPNDIYDANTQRAIAAEIYNEQGLGAWEGFRRNPGARQRAAAAGSAINHGSASSSGRRIAGMSPVEVRQLQRTLNMAGYYNGEIDGIAGSQTKQALAGFQADINSRQLRARLPPVNATGDFVTR